MDVSGSPDDWVGESHELAKSVAYSPELFSEIRGPNALIPFSLSDDYFVIAGSHARRRIVAAGLRLAAMFGAKVDSTETPGQDFSPVVESSLTPFAPRHDSLAPPASAAKQIQSYWLNTNGNVRHNSGCRWFENLRTRRVVGRVPRTKGNRADSAAASAFCYQPLARFAHRE